MSLPVALTDEAEADLDEAAQWYERLSAGLGVQFVTQVRAALGRVEFSPNLHGEIHAGVRRCPVRRFPYGVLYRVQPTVVEVIAVFHNRNDPAVWQARS